MLKRRKGLIVGFDKVSFVQILDLAPKISDIDENIIFKISDITFNDNYHKKKQILEYLNRLPNPLVYDAKVAQMKDYAIYLVEENLEDKYDAIIAHGILGGKTIGRLAELTQDTNIDIIAVSYLSDDSAEEFYVPLGIDIAKSAIKAGAKGIVAGATYPKALEEIRKAVDEINEDVYILSPGVSPYQGGDPKFALKLGADYLVVSNSVTGSEEPIKEIEKYLDTISSFS